MASAIAKVFYDLIKANTWKLEDVPLRWREEVQALLDGDEA